MKLVNLTPHVVVIEDAAGSTLHTIELSGEVARVEAVYEHHAMLDLDGQEHNPVACYTRRFGAVKGLPTYLNHDARYIVSSMALAALPGQVRSDEEQLFVAPGEPIREPADDGTRQALIAAAEAYLASATRLEDVAAPLVADLLAFVRAQAPQPGRVVACRGLVAGS